jgi:hypothetical protein
MGRNTEDVRKSEAVILLTTNCKISFWKLAAWNGKENDLQKAV